MIPKKFFEEFRSTIDALPDLALGQKYARADLIAPQFRLFVEGKLAGYYAPFHNSAPRAQVAIVGLTPGFTQMEGAFRACKAGLRKGLRGAKLFDHIDRAGSFSGPMRPVLIDRLNGIGIGDRIGATGAAELFHAPGLAHFTSAVSAPIFKGDSNYAGSVVRPPKLREWVLQVLADELAALSPETIIVPLGVEAGHAVELVANGGRIDRRRCLIGMPHPSTGPGHADRVLTYNARRSAMAEQLASL